MTRPAHPLRVRPGTAADVAAVVELVESAYRGDASRAGWTTEAGMLEGRRTGPDEVAGAISEMLLAEVDGQLVGCCRVERVPSGAYFGMFAISPVRQAEGLGKQLLSAAEASAVERWGNDGGPLSMEMTVLAQRDELLAFYDRRGYRPTGETRPFPYGDQRFGIPLRTDLYFTVLAKQLQ